MSFYIPFVLCSALLSNAFSFTSSTPSQCDQLHFNWTGGSGTGYYATVIPIFGVPRNITIPDSAFSSDGSGAFSATLESNATDKIVLTMSDSSGFGTGGSSKLLDVGASLGGSCDTRSPVLSFTYMLSPSNSITQCQTSGFNSYTESGAVPPVTIIGVIPGGDSFVLHPVPNAKTFNWLANVYNGTNIIFFMFDANGNQGGSELFSVGLSGDTSCVTGDSPSSTTALSSAAPTSTVAPSVPSASSSTVPSTLPSTPHPSSTGAIAGSVLGALIFLAVLITLGLFFLRQWQERKQSKMPSGSEFRRASRPLDSQLDLHQTAHLFDSPLPTPAGPYDGHNQSLSAQAPRPPAHYQPHSPYLSSHPLESENPFGSSTTSLDASVNPFMDQSSDTAASTERRKSGMSAFSGYKPSRYIVHTDAEDADLPANEDGVVEVPPQYSSSRPPPRGLLQSHTYNNPSSS